MKKVLAIIFVSAGIISAVAAIILGCIYFAEIAKRVSDTKTKFFGRFKQKDSDFTSDF